MTPQEDKLILEKYANLLMEHFDSVQVFCTRYESKNDQTVYVNSGAGNFAARLGQTLEWCAYQDACTREKAKLNTHEENL